MDFASISKLLQADAKKAQMYAEAKDAIDSLAAKSNLVKEIESAILSKKAEKDKLDGQISDCTKALEEIDAEGKLSKALAEEDAAKIITEAKAKAAAILNDADKKQVDIMNIVALAEKDLADINKAVQASREIKAKLDAQIESIKKSLGV